MRLDPRPFSPQRRAILTWGGLGLVVGGTARTGSVAAVNPATAAELQRAGERGALCSVDNATGSGLRGEYFAHGVGGEAPLLVRVDSTIDFDNGLEWPGERAAQRPLAARWTGWVRPSLSGKYAFHVDQPGTKVVVAQQPVTGNVPIELAAGRYYPISIEATRLDRLNGRLKLEWTVPFGARYVVPRGLLFMPSERVGGSGP